MRCWKTSRERGQQAEIPTMDLSPDIAHGYGQEKI